MKESAFSAPAEFVKAWEESGEKYVTLIASDTGPDRSKGVDRDGGWKFERIHPNFLAKMVEQARAGGLVVNDVHGKRFGFGVVVGHDDEVARQHKERYGYDAFAPVVRLKTHFPEAVELWEEVSGALREGRKPAVQASIGGATTEAARVYEPALGGFGKELRMGRLHEITMTFEGIAANPRTGFVAAIAKSVDWDDAPIFGGEGQFLTYEEALARGMPSGAGFRKSSEALEKTSTEGGGMERLSEPALVGRKEKKMSQQVFKIKLDGKVVEKELPAVEEGGKTYLRLTEEELQELIDDVRGEVSPPPDDALVEQQMSDHAPSTRVLVEKLAELSVQAESVQKIPNLTKKQRNDVLLPLLERAAEDASWFLNVRAKAAWETLKSCLEEVCPFSVEEVVKVLTEGKAEGKAEDEMTKARRGKPVEGNDDDDDIEDEDEEEEDEDEGEEDEGEEDEEEDENEEEDEDEDEDEYEDEDEDENEDEDEDEDEEGNPTRSGAVKKAAESGAFCPVCEKSEMENGKCPGCGYELKKWKEVVTLLKMGGHDVPPELEARLKGETV